MLATVQAVQSYFVCPVATVNWVELTIRLAVEATVAVIVFDALPDPFEKLVIVIVEGAEPVLGVKLPAGPIAALVMELIATGPVPSNASVMAAFEVSKTLAVSDRAATQPAPEGQ